jgi:hypothetical protein
MMLMDVGFLIFGLLMMMGWVGTEQVGVKKVQRRNEYFSINIYLDLEEERDRAD